MAPLYHRGDMPEPRQTLLVTVDSYPIAHIISEKLNAEGIVCLTINVGDQMAGDLTTRGGVGAFAYQYEIWVSDRDLDRARDLVTTKD